MTVEQADVHQNNTVMKFVINAGISSFVIHQQLSAVIKKNSWSSEL